MWRRSGADAEPDRRCGVQGIDQALGLEPPEVIEGAPIELEHGRAVDAPRSAQRRLTVVRSGHVAEWVLQEVETLTQAEPGVDERERVGRGQCTRHDGHVTGSPEPFDALLHATPRGR